MSTVTVGAQAPDFALTGTDGHQYQLAEALGRGPVLTAFFKVVCPTCQYTLPFVERIRKQLSPDRVQIWGISQDDGRASERFAKEYGLSFPILFDPYPYETSRAYGLRYVPTLVLVLPDGRVDLVSDGFSRVDLIELQGRLAKLLAATPPPLFLPKERIPEFKPG